MSALRLVFSGFPCAPEPWRQFLPDDRRNEVVPFSQVLAGAARLSLSAMASIVATEIAARKPATIVCHDFGGPCTLLAVAKLARRQALHPCKLVVFNTALRGFNVLVNRHPWHMQRVTWERLREFSAAHGTVADEAYATLLPRVRALYRLIILGSLVSLVVRPGKKRFTLEVPALFLRSNDDPFIARGTLDALAEDVPFTKIVDIDYGHFPYSHHNAQALRAAIVAFEAT